MEIKKLPDDVISHIAAGEVVTSPLNVIKELVENSLDAGSSFIKIIIKKDFSTIEVIDNGSGIEKEDVSNICKKHYTSKFSGSLYDLKMFGFRGEALASISQTAKVFVETRVDHAEFGYTAEFARTEMLHISPICINKGTRVIIKDLFYNNQVRRMYFSRKRDEVSRILHLLMCFSTYHFRIAFHLMIDKNIKFNHNPESFLRILSIPGPTNQGNTIVGPTNNTTKPKIPMQICEKKDSDACIKLPIEQQGVCDMNRDRNCDSSSLRKKDHNQSKLEERGSNFLEMESLNDSISKYDSQNTNFERPHDPNCPENPNKSPDCFSSDDSDKKRTHIMRKQVLNSLFKTLNHLISDSGPEFSLIISDLGYSGRKYVFICFINRRYVSHGILKDRILTLYKQYLPKRTFPLVYIEIEVPSAILDVNVHPAKKEVLFENESILIDRILSCVKHLISTTGSLNLDSINKSYDLKINHNISSVSNPSMHIYTDPNLSFLFEYQGFHPKSDDSNGKIRQDPPNSVKREHKNLDILHNSRETISDLDLSNEHSSRFLIDLESQSTHDLGRNTNNNFLKYDAETSTSNYNLGNTLKEISLPYKSINLQNQSIDTTKEHTLKYFKLMKNNLKKSFVIYKYKSLHYLRSKIVSVSDDFCSNLVYVGASSDIIFVQSSLDLLCCKFYDLGSHFFYQYFLFNFGNFDTVSVDFIFDFSFSNLKRRLLNEFFGFCIEGNSVSKVPCVLGIHFSKNTLVDFFRDFSLYKICFEIESDKQQQNKTSHVLEKAHYHEKQVIGYNMINMNYKSAKKTSLENDYENSLSNRESEKINPDSLETVFLNLQEPCETINHSQNWLSNDKSIDLGKTAELKLEKRDMVEIKTFDWLFRRLSHAFASEPVNYSAFFSQIKRTLICTQDFFNIFSVVTSLKHLYKYFERC